MLTKDLEAGHFNIKFLPGQTKTNAFVFVGMLYIPLELVFGLSPAPLIFICLCGLAVMAIRFTDRNSICRDLLCFQSSDVFSSVITTRPQKRGM